jgi:hypothetical protein
MQLFSGRVARGLSFYFSYPLRRAIAACCAAAVSVAAAGGEARADDPPPVEQGALVRGFALPRLGRPEVLAQGALRQNLGLGETNEFADRANLNEAILLDGETTQLSYDLRRGIGGGWEVGAFAPLLALGGGFLDPIIQDWHHLWGLPNGNRGLRPNNAYAYEYTVDNRSLLSVTQGAVSLGDMQVTAGREIGRRTALRGMLKLPTGDASHLAGNGAFGGAVWVDSALPRGLLGRWDLYGSAGYSYTGTGQVLAAQQRHALPFGALGIGYRLSARWSALGQLYIHDAPYRDSDLAPLVRVAAPLTLSAIYHFDNKNEISLGFQEKLTPLAAPDFGLHLGVSF